MMEEFRASGYEIVDFEKFADVYVVNTCTVTNMSDRKSRQMLRRAKEINPNSLLCAVGCYAQVAKEELEKIEEIDIILGNNDKRNIINAVENAQKDKKQATVVTDMMAERTYIEWKQVAYTDKARAEVKVQDGCDRYCTYCIIPYARGPVRSRKIADIKREVEIIAETGIKEIIITGIHISSYGKDLPDKPALIDMLEEIHEVEGIERIRLGSLEPLIITNEFVERIKHLPKLCNHFHLSLQSGCDATLERMNRRYDTKAFKEIVKILRENIPDVALTTDVIVGFPGETDEEFEITRKFLEDVRFSKMHVFKYSKRRGTKAATFKNQVDGKLADERSEVLLKMSDENEELFRKSFSGRELPVLFENEHEGHTTNYIEVYSKEEQIPNSIVYMKF